MRTLNALLHEKKVSQFGLKKASLGVCDVMPTVSKMLARNGTSLWYFQLSQQLFRVGKRLFDVWPFVKQLFCHINQWNLASASPGIYTSTIKNGVTLTSVFSHISVYKVSGLSNSSVEHILQDANRKVQIVNVNSALLRQLNTTTRILCGV